MGLCCVMISSSCERNVGSFKSRQSWNINCSNSDAFTNKEMQEIIPGLYLGPALSATEAKLHRLEEAGITHIICVRHGTEAGYIQPNFPEKFVYSVIDLVGDSETPNIIPLIPQVKQFIDNCFKTGGKVLVHGDKGVSKSAALVIGYIMETRKMPYTEAFTLVQVKRDCICPSEAFMHQLREYEPIYKAKRSFHVNGHTSRVTGKLKRKSEQLEDYEIVNSMDICDDSGV